MTRLGLGVTAFIIMAGYAPDGWQAGWIAAYVVWIFSDIIDALIERWLA